MAQPKRKPAIEYAMHYLSRFPKTTYELRLKLLEKGYYETEIETTLKQLSRNKYLDDKMFATMYIESELIRKGKPVYVIKGKLLKKWVDADLLDQLLDAHEKEINKGLLKWILKDVEKYKKRWLEWFDIAEKLYRKGYTMDQIREALDLR